MGMIFYGTRTFSKHLGYVGEKEVCQNCGKEYRKSVVRYRRWFHLNWIPLFPVKSTYYEMCPVCAFGAELKGKEAQEELAAAGSQETQSLEYYAKHILANKKKGIMSADQSYEFWMRDKHSGEEICIASGVRKDDVKEMKKVRGIIEFEYIDVQ